MGDKRGAGDAATEPTRSEHFPPIDESREVFDAAIARVTLLEDRAQVLRRGRLALTKGTHRLVVLDVAPVIQDVSLRAHASAGNARVTDVRLRRAMRVRREHKPEELRTLESRYEDVARRFYEHGHDRGRAERQLAALREMQRRSLLEIPEDVAWGRANEELWQETFEELARRAHQLGSEQLEHWFAQQDLVEAAQQIAAERRALDRVDHHLVAWIEVDVIVPDETESVLEIEYTAANALWRPLHSARLLSDGKLVFTSQAAVWQSTGEDWKDCELVFSTARTSHGTEPPLLTEDRLTGQRRSEVVMVQSRDVKVHRARTGGGKGASPASDAVDLPGVDDGGDTQSLRAEGLTTVPADGRPNVIPLFTFQSEAETTLVTMPELDETVFLRARQDHTGKAAILAGPVELVRESGAVGWTKTLFVAPGERFELSFGPDDAVRVTRRAQSEPVPDPVGHWAIELWSVVLYLSNLGEEEKVVEVTECIPVSEIEHVKVTLVDDGTDPAPAIDENGLVRWLVPLGAHGRSRVKLAWRHAVAPGVRQLQSPRAPA